MMKFALQRGVNSSESKILKIHNILHESICLKEFDNAEDVPDDFVPEGTIDWVTSVLGVVPVPDHYPKFLQHLLYRKVWKATEWPMEKNIFIKPYDKPKRFQAIITTGSYKEKKKGPYWCSEVVQFTNEWRYYIINGKVIYSGWYAGKDDDLEPPKFDELLIPEDWCGCIDMGLLSTGEFALVEAGEPYSIGWYGKLEEGAIYSQFLYSGWTYLYNKYNSGDLCDK